MSATIKFERTKVDAFNVRPSALKIAPDADPYWNKANGTLEKYGAKSADFNEARKVAASMPEKYRAAFLSSEGGQTFIDAARIAAYEAHRAIVLTEIALISEKSKEHFAGLDADEIREENRATLERFQKLNLRTAK